MSCRLLWIRISQKNDRNIPVYWDRLNVEAVYFQIQTWKKWHNFSKLADFPDPNSEKRIHFFQVSDLASDFGLDSTFCLMKKTMPCLFGIVLKGGMGMKKICVSNHPSGKIGGKTGGMSPVRSGAAVLLLTGVSYLPNLK